MSRRSSNDAQEPVKGVTGETGKDVTEESVASEDKKQEMTGIAVEEKALGGNKKQLTEAASADNEKQVAKEVEAADSEKPVAVEVTVPDSEREATEITAGENDQVIKEASAVANEKPVKEEPAADKNKKPVTEEPAADTNKNPVTEEPAADENENSVMEEPAADENERPVAGELAADKNENPMTEEPAAEMNENMAGESSEQANRTEPVRHGVRRADLENSFDVSPASGETAIATALRSQEIWYAVSRKGRRKVDVDLVTCNDPLHKIDDINIIFSMDKETRDQFLEKHGISPCVFYLLQPMSVLMQWLKKRRIQVCTSDPALWMLLMMSAPDRNCFLFRIGYKEIAPHQVRNVHQLIEAVTTLWPGILDRFANDPVVFQRRIFNPSLVLTTGFPENLVFTKAFSGKSVSCILNFQSLGEIMDWIEEENMAYQITHPYLWRFMEISNENRKEVLKKFKDMLKTRERVSIRKMSHLKIENNDARSIRELVLWLNRVFGCLDQVQMISCQELEEKMDFATLTLDALIATILENQFVYLTPVVSKRQYFHCVNMLHMMSRSEREQHLAEHGLQLSDIEALESFNRFKFFLQHYALLEDKEPTCFQKYFDKLLQNRQTRNIPKTWLSYDNGSYTSLTTVGELFEWLYRTKEARFVDYPEEQAAVKQMEKIKQNNIEKQKKAEAKEKAMKQSAVTDEGKTPGTSQTSDKDSPNAQTSTGTPPPTIHVTSSKSSTTLGVQAEP